VAPGTAASPRYVAIVSDGGAGTHPTCHVPCDAPTLLEREREREIRTETCPAVAVDPEASRYATTDRSD
jgi:hypothetical protein